MWVVPYNPYLLLKYNSHVDVEVCSTICAIKYLYKYVYKGHDRIMFELKNKNDDNNDNKDKKNLLTEYRIILMQGTLVLQRQFIGYLNLICMNSLQM